MASPLALVLSFGLALSVGAATARAQPDAMPGMHHGKGPMTEGMDSTPEGCMQMMKAMREQDAELERRLERMKSASASEARLDAMAALVEALAQQHLAHHAMMRDMPMCKGMMPMGRGVMRTASGGPEGQTYTARGRVESVDPDQGTVTIDHEDIPGLMKAMTMTFETADPRVAEEVSPGQAVDFRLKKEGSRWVVTEIEVCE